MSALRYRLIAYIIDCKRCPCCGGYQADTDHEEHSVWRNPDDFAAVKFNCGAEFSVDENDDIISRIPCSEPSFSAALEMKQAAEDGLEEAA